MVLIHVMINEYVNSAGEAIGEVFGKSDITESVLRLVVASLAHVNRGFCSLAGSGTCPRSQCRKGQGWDSEPESSDPLSRCLSSSACPNLIWDWYRAEYL